MMVRLWFLLLLVLIDPAIAQQNQCRTSPPGTSTPYCSSEAFVTDSIAAIPTGGDVTGPASSTTGHVATFADTTGKVIQDGGAPAGGTVSAAGNGLTLGGGGTTLGITAPVSTPNGGTGVVSPTAHTVPLNQGASAQTNVALSAGQVLGSDGSTDPKAISGSRILLATLTCPNNTTQFCDDTTHITGSYNDYEIVFEDLIPATNAVQCQIQLFASNVIQTSGYLATSFGSAGVGSSTTTFIPCSQGAGVANTGGRGLSGTIRSYGNPASFSGSFIMQWNGLFSYHNSAGAAFFATVSGYINTAPLITGVRAFFGSGNITSGTIKIYGML